MSNTWFKEHEKDIFIKYSDEELLKNLDSFQYGKSSLNKITKHFFDEIMFNCVSTVRKLRYPETPYQALNDDKFMEKIFKYIKRYPKIFRYDENSNENIDMYVRKFFSFSYPRMVSQFPAKNVVNVIRKLYPDHDWFDEPLNYHDASCGFGMRLTASLLNNCNYYGTDPNKELVIKLNELYDFIKKYHRSNTDAEIRCVGSEEYISEWENKMDLSFTSPPYFNLEKYSDDNCKSTLNYKNYDKWIEEYSIPTIDNTIKYLKTGGYLCINIKNITKYMLYDDYVKILDGKTNLMRESSIDLEMDHTKDYVTTINGITGKNFEISNYKEKIMVYKKIDG